MKSGKSCLHWGSCTFDTILDKETKCKSYLGHANCIEVVRCKDCKHLLKETEIVKTPYDFENTITHFGCGRVLDLTGEWLDVMIDDFCSYGESK